MWICEMDASTEYKSFSDLVALCFQSFMDSAVLESFREFLRENGDKHWLIASDYHVDKHPDFENYVWVFTVFPFGQNRLSLAEMNAGLPTKLSDSVVTEGDITFLRQANHFSFVFVNDKNFRPAAPTAKAARESLDISIKHMKRWTNASECTDVINEFRRLRQDANAVSFNLKLLNQAILCASCASAIALEIIETVSIDSIAWLSDRDAMIDNLNGIAYTIFKLNLIAFYQLKNLRPFEIIRFIDEEGEPLAKKNPLAFAPYIRVPDYLAAPVATAFLTAEGVQFLNKEKYQRILAFVIANNSKIAVLRLDNNPGWRITRIKVSVAPSHAEVANRAFQLWKLRGLKHGNDLGDWYEAERTLVNETDES